MRTRQKILSIAALAAAIGCTGVANAGPTMQSFTTLPSPNCGLSQTNNCIQFGDFTVYSLGLLYTQAYFAQHGSFPTTNPNPGKPFYVASDPGELGRDGYIVYGTGTNNNNVVTNGNGRLIDDAQQQPTGSGSHPPFVVGAATETTPTFTGDDPARWSGTLSAIRTELAAGSAPDGKFVIYFNLNETGTDGLAGIDLLTWFHVSLIDKEGILPELNYYLTGKPGSTDTPNVGNDSDPNWVTVTGTICVSATAGFLSFGPCDAAQKALGGKDVNENLGQNTAAFAIYNADLSDMVLNSDYDYIQGNWMFSNINNGYEQEFSALTPMGQNVPEPNSLLLVALGLGTFSLMGALRKTARV
jgi:hypothetical protein